MFSSDFQHRQKGWAEVLRDKRAEGNVRPGPEVLLRRWWGAGSTQKQRRKSRTLQSLRVSAPDPLLLGRGRQRERGPVRRSSQGASDLHQMEKRWTQQLPKPGALCWSVFQWRMEWFPVWNKLWYHMWNKSIKSVLAGFRPSGAQEAQIHKWRSKTCRLSSFSLSFGFFFYILMYRISESTSPAQRPASRSVSALLPRWTRERII